ncbi:hypothetical protein ACFU7C_23475, partial [Streptomyces bacillaris]
PRTVPDSTGDREHPDAGAGTEPGGDRPRTVPNDNGDRIGERDSRLSGQGEEAKTGGHVVVPETGEDGGGAGGDVHVVTAQRGSGPSPAVVPDDDGGRESPVTETGTEPDGDRPRTVPLRRKPPQKGARSRPGAGKAKRRRNGPRLTVEEMVERVRPHVPELLERDGNESVTRSQLREILRALNLPGGRNERLTPVLQRLRDEAATTTTRSTAR